MPELWFYIVIFVFAACVGSFLNVCIYRLPAGLSVVSPPSACPACRTRISPYENIPILSYLMLGARCRHCKEPIHWRYPLVELLTAVLAILLYYRYGLTVDALIYFGLVAALIVVTFIDLDHRIIPNRITLPAIPLGFLFSFVLAEPGYLASALGVVVGGGSLLLMAYIYSAIAKKEGMGGGDIKLLAMIGAFLGWEGVVFTIVSASLLGSVVGLSYLSLAGKGSDFPIPFGPFLAFGALLYLFLGDYIVGFYLGLLWAR